MFYFYLFIVYILILIFLIYFPFISFYNYVFNNLKLKYIFIINYFINFGRNIDVNLKKFFNYIDLELDKGEYIKIYECIEENNNNNYWDEYEDEDDYKEKLIYNYNVTYNIDFIDMDDFIDDDFLWFVTYEGYQKRWEGLKLMIRDNVIIYFNIKYIRKFYYSLLKYNLSLLYFPPFIFIICLLKLFKIIIVYYNLESFKKYYRILYDYIFNFITVFNKYAFLPLLSRCNCNNIIEQTNGIILVKCNRIARENMIDPNGYTDICPIHYGMKCDLCRDYHLFRLVPEYNNSIRNTRHALVNRINNNYVFIYNLNIPEQELFSLSYFSLNNHLQSNLISSPVIAQIELVNRIKYLLIFPMLSSDYRHDRWIENLHEFIINYPGNINFNTFNLYYDMYIDDYFDDFRMSL